MSDAQRNDLSVAMSIAERIKEVIAGLRRDLCLLRTPSTTKSLMFPRSGSS
jgi:hypothetical protein